MKTFTDKELWDYQIDARTKTLTCFELNPLARILCKVPTSGGKTLILGAIIVDEDIRAILLAGKKRKTLRVVYKTHRNRLLLQAERTYEKHELIAKIDSFDHWLNNEKPINEVEIIYISLATKLPEGIDIDLVVLDECHHEACTTYQDFLNYGGGYPSIGLTATDDRPDGLLIKYDFIIEPITREEAVRRGIVCETDIKTIVDISPKNKVVIFKEIMEHFGHEFGQTILYFRTKKEVAEAVNILRAMGYVAYGILNQKDREVDQILNMFSSGDVQFLVNAQKLSEGIDLKGCTDVGIFRYNRSYTLLNQIIGRAARPDDPRCMVWEIINPMSGNNLDTTIVVGQPKSHEILSRVNGQWERRMFEAA